MGSGLGDVESLDGFRESIEEIDGEVGGRKKCARDSGSPCN